SRLVRRGASRGGQAAHGWPARHACRPDRARRARVASRARAPAGGSDGTGMRIAAVIITCAGREEVCRGTVDALRATDWPGAWPVLVSWDHGIEGTPQHRQQLNALNALRAGIGLEPDFILFLEDDVAFNAHLSHN